MELISFCKTYHYLFRQGCAQYFFVKTDYTCLLEEKLLTCVKTQSRNALV